MSQACRTDECGPEQHRHMPEEPLRTPAILDFIHGACDGHLVSAKAVYLWHHNRGYPRRLMTYETLFGRFEAEIEGQRTAFTPLNACRTQVPAPHLNQALVLGPNAGDLAAGA